MGWTREGGTITFACDSCPTTADVSVTAQRHGAAAPATVSDFAVCWVSLQAAGWRSFKREGFNWTYHCRACADQAEQDHTLHKRHEEERERIKARNESR